MYVKRSDGKLERRPYDLLVRAAQTYLHPHHGRETTVFDGIRVYDEAPPWDLQR